MPVCQKNKLAIFLISTCIIMIAPVRLVLLTKKSNSITGLDKVFEVCELETTSGIPSGD